MTNFNKNSGIGRLAVDRHDYEEHVTGQDRRHTDAQIDLAEALIEIDGTTVHEALVELNDKIINADYFVTIGEGYDVYESGAFDAAAPFLDAEINDVLYNTSNPKNARLRDGGVLVIKSGTYKISTTIDIPAGITLMGEGFGTKLVNVTLNEGGASAPMFRIKGDIDRYEDRAVVSSSISHDPFLTSKGVRFRNFVISDNFLKPAYLGDTAYRSAQNTALPLVYLECGGGLECDGVSFFGRSGGGNPASTTLSAIEIDPLSGSTYSTSLVVRNCEFDGFNRLIAYTPTKGGLDHFVFKNNKARAFGPVGGSATAQNSNVLFANACNMDISSNYIWTDPSLLAMVYIDDVTADAVTTQAKSKILVANNVFAADKTSASATLTVTAISINSSIVSPYDKLAVYSYGNSFDSRGGFSIDSGIVFSARSVSSNYTVTGNDYIVLVDTTSSAVSVTLPAHQNGRTLIVKDIGGNASTNNITLVRNGSTGNIDDYAGDRIISTNWTSLTLVSNGTNWYII